MEIKDLEEKFKEFSDKMEKRIKDPEEKKKFQEALEALNNTEIQKKVDDSMVAVNEILKKLMNND